MSTLALELLSSAVHGRVTLEKSRYDLTRLRDQYDGKSFDAAGLKFTWDIGSNTHQIKIDDLFYAWLSLSSSDDVETRDDNRFNLAVADCISTVNHSRQFKDPSDISREELIDAVEQIKKMAKQLHVLLARLPKRTRMISSARVMSPAASVSAFLQSIIGASVRSRSSFTMPAVISAITCSLQIQ